jgi:CheY-specific phosphatase CheX
MRNTTKATIDFRVWNVGSNMPGYMPDSEPYPCASLDEARECLVEEIERDIDDLLDASVAGDDVGIVERLAELVKYCRESGAEEIGVTVGNRHYFITSDAMTGEELESCDCDPCDYSPVLGEWIDAETINALESAGIDFDIIEAQTRYSSEQSDESWTKCEVYDDSFGSWFVGKRECGAWVYPSLIIRAKSFEDAYGIFEDESPTVPTGELHDAYDMTPEEFQTACDRMKSQREEFGMAADIDYPELADGYSHQSSSSGTGIVYTADMHLDAAGAEHNQVRFKVTID